MMPNDLPWTNKGQTYATHIYKLHVPWTSKYISLCFTFVLSRKYHRMTFFSMSKLRTAFCTSGPGSKISVRFALRPAVFDLQAIYNTIANKCPQYDYTLNPLDINRTSYMESPLDLTLSRSLRFQSLISCIGAKLGPMWLLTIKRKVYMASPMTPWHLTLSDIERSNSRSGRFQSVISRKGPKLGPMLLLTINRKPCMGSLMPTWHLILSDLESSSSRSLRLLSGKGSVVFDITLDVT